MTVRLVSRGDRRAWSRFARDSGGLVFVEFALTAPFLLLMFMGLIDFSRAFCENRRIVVISSTLADLVSQQSTTDALTPSTVDSVMNAAAAIMMPYPTSNLKLTVSAIQLSANGGGACCQAKVQWTVTRGGQLRPCSTPLSQAPSTTPPAPSNILSAMVDSSMLGNSSSAQLIVADVSGQYQPLFGQLTSFFIGGLQRTTYRFTRSWGQLTLSSSSSTPTGDQMAICPST